MTETSPKYFAVQVSHEDMEKKGREQAIKDNTEGMRRVAKRCGYELIEGTEEITDKPYGVEVFYNAREVQED